MSTNSYIGRLLPNGSVEYIYCHFDGAPSHNGRILATYYNDPAKVSALMALGDLSSLGANIGDKIDFNKSQTYVPDAARQCVSYKRDRGDKGRDGGNDGVDSQTVVNERAYSRAGKRVPYQYLFKAGAYGEAPQWHVSRGGGNFILVSDVVSGI